MLSGGKIAIDVGASTPLVLGASSIYVGTAGLGCPAERCSADSLPPTGVEQRST